MTQVLLFIDMEFPRVEKSWKIPGGGEYHETGRNGKSWGWEVNIN